MVRSFLCVDANLWGRYGDFGRTPDADKLRWVASQDLKVVMGTVLSRRPAYVAVDGFERVWLHWCTPAGLNLLDRKSVV